MPSKFCGECKRDWTEPGQRTLPVEEYVMSILFPCSHIGNRSIQDHGDGLPIYD